jgi:3-hydroxyisobutyrate dehydrogenase
MNTNTSASPAAADRPVHSTSVAVLGTGIMGAAMARSLRRAGLEVRVWNRTPERAAPLAEAGARVEQHASDAVRGADVVLTMLSDVRAVLGAMAAAEPGLSEGQIWLQASTVGHQAIPQLADYAAKHGLRLVDAPVSGTRKPAEEGQLLVLAAGPQDVRQPLTPVLDAIGARTLWLGDDAAAATASRLKLVVNSVVLAETTLAAEAVELSEALGLDPALFAKTMEGGVADSKFLQAKVAAITAGDFTPNFSAAMAAKDARLIVEAGAEHGLALPMNAAIADRMARAVALGHGEQDMAATYYAGREQDGE